MKLVELPGERAHLRWIRHDDPEEMRRLVSIDMDENVRRYVLETTGDEDELRNFAVRYKKSIGIAIAGRSELVGGGRDGSAPRLDCHLSGPSRAVGQGREAGFTDL